MAHSPPSRPHSGPPLPRHPRWVGPTVLMLVLAFAPAVCGDTWELLHHELRSALADLSQEYFGPESTLTLAPGQIPTDATPHLWMVVVGFTGGIERHRSPASGVVAMGDHLQDQMGRRDDILSLTFNNFRWRRAATEVIGAVSRARTAGRLWPGARQPLIVVVGHSWGAGSIHGLANRLAEHGLEIALAVYIDSFCWRNPRVPGNVRNAVTFYQRSGILRGLPMRGKRKLIPRDPSRTRILGAYRIDPQTDHWGWSWNLLQPLLYRHHHRIAHDNRLKDYLIDIVRVNRHTLAQITGWSPPPTDHLFARVVILGGDLSADRDRSPGVLLARRAGTPDEEIFCLAEPRAESEDVIGLLDNMEALQPSLVVALDLFDRDFDLPRIFGDTKRQSMAEVIGRLTATGATVAVGLLPDRAWASPEPVNQFLHRLAARHPNLVLIDRHRRPDLDPDQLADLLWVELQARQPNRLPPDLTPGPALPPPQAPDAPPGEPS